MEPWVWPVLLLAVGLSLAVLEVFVPSGGAIGFLSAAAIIVSIFLAFRQGSEIGVAIMTGAMIGVPVVIIVALQVWPKTSMGKRMLLKATPAEELLPDSPKQRFLKGLVGRVGTAKSLMLPSGAVQIDGKTIDAMTEGPPVEVGGLVRVIEVRGNRVVVRPVDKQEPSPDAKNPLDRPVEDPFRDASA